jgi:Asp-tRNA(Asn)/Glu-tRNA(Gln) amidotransferase B subunit
MELAKNNFESSHEKRAMSSEEMKIILDRIQENTILPQFFKQMVSHTIMEYEGCSKEEIMKKVYNADIAKYPLFETIIIDIFGNNPKPISYHLRK